MDYMYIWSIIAGVMFVGLVILIVTIINENADNIDCWRGASEDWWRSRTGKRMRP